MSGCRKFKYSTVTPVSSIKNSTKAPSLHKKQEKQKKNGYFRSAERGTVDDFFVRSSLQPRLLGPANMSCMEGSLPPSQLVERSSLLQGVRRKIN